MNISANDKRILRQLAQTYMDYATLPAQEERRELWRALNGLQMRKPMVAIDQMPWHELDVDGSLVCLVEHPYFRQVEQELRRLIYKWEHLPADMVLEPYILLPRPIRNSGYGLAPEAQRTKYDEKSDMVARHYENVIQSLEDVEKIAFPQLTLDREEEAEFLHTAETIFAGIAPVRMQGITLHLGLWDTVTEWMGVEACYIALMEQPELLHAVMERLTQATLGVIDQVNRLGLQDIHGHLCHCSYTYGELPSATCDPEHPTTADGWAFGLAQLFTAVSPAVTAEFEVPYMQRLFPHFGAIYYGCCDRLDDRLDIIARMPGIRKISCSPWSNRENFAANLPPEYIMSNKPTPALLAGDSFDEDAVRADLRRTIEAASRHGLGLEMILKDISTVRYQPQRLWRWAEIAAEETVRAAL